MQAMQIVPELVHVSQLKPQGSHKLSAFTKKPLWHVDLHKRVGDELSIIS